MCVITIEELKYRVFIPIGAIKYMTITPPTAVPHHINIYTYIVILSVIYNINVYNIYMYCNNYLFTFFNIQSTSKLYIIK